jgi:nucleoside-diphosphate-sugar epimerase
MKILLTGHKGYIGTVMSTILMDAGHTVIGYDSSYYEDCILGKYQDNFSELRKDIRDLTVADLKGIEAVIHLAALSNDPVGNLNPELTYQINLEASIKLARLAREAGVKRFLFSSSCSIYGAGKGDDLLDEDAPLTPITPYAISKIKVEDALVKMADNNFSPVLMRNATAYGFSPRLRADIVLNNLVAWAFTTGKIRIMSDGSPWRPIVHIEDISRAFLIVLTAQRELIHNQAINIGGNSENYQVRDLANIVKSIIPNADVEYAGDGAVDLRNYRVNFGKLSKLLPDFSLKWNAKNGAQQLLDAYIANDLKKDEFLGRKYIRLNQIEYLLKNQYIDEQLRWQQ